MRPKTSRSRGPKPQRRIRLTRPEYRDLKRISRLRPAPYAQVVRAKILVLAYEHPEWSNVAIGRAVGCTDRTVRKWRSPSRAGPAYQEAPRPGGPRFFPLRGPRPSDRARLHVAPRLG